jgi:hypothetical protein
VVRGDQTSSRFEGGFEPGEAQTSLGYLLERAPQRALGVLALLSSQNRVVPIPQNRVAPIPPGRNFYPYARIGRKLIESIVHSTVVRDDSALTAFAVRPMGVEEAVRRALANDDRPLP